jgi:5-methylthioadenosine/S-adenosylhomocysteine deaminase
LGTTDTVKADSIISARWVVPVEPPGLVLDDHSLVVIDSKIADILPTRDVTKRYLASEHVQLPEHALIPGLVNLHGHAAMTLMRGLADDLPLMQWLEKHIWPAEARHVSAEFVYDGTLLACAEMLMGGITTFNDMYFYPAAAAQAALDSGMRAAIGLITLEFPSSYASDAEDYMQKGLAARDALRQESRLTFCMAPHAPYTVSDRTFGRVILMAEELDMPVHMHLHETQDEISGSLANHGCRPLQRMQQLGLMGARLIAVHAVHLLPAEIDQMAKAGVSVAHCPSSNLKLASGFAPVARLLDQGINVGLGTDGAASNNRLDMFQEMRLAALLAKAVEADAGAMPARQALSAATLGGARALGLEKLMGSLVAGKAADLCAVKLSGPGLVPCFDVISHLVYACGRENVTDVWVDGVRRLSDGALKSVNEHNLYSRARLWHTKLVAETKT